MKLNYNYANTFRQRLSSQGFSLLEIMIVVLIIGISASMAVLYVDNSEERLKSEAKRLFAISQLVRDDAIITGQSLAMIVNTADYSFARLEKGEWVKLSKKPFKKITLNNDIRLHFTIKEKKAVKNSNNLRSLYFFPTGETSEFQLWISNETTEYLLSSTTLGELSLKKVDKL